MLYLLVAERPKFPKCSLVLISFLGLILVACIASVFSDNPAISFFSTYERMDGIVTLLHLGAFFVLLSTMFTEKKTWHRFFLVSLAISVVVFVTTLGQYIELSAVNKSVNVRTNILLGNATYLGTYAMLHFFLAFYLLFQQVRFSFLQVLVFGIMILNFVTLIFSGTRSALLGLLGGLGIAIVIYLIFTTHIKRLYKFVAAGVFLFILFIGFTVAYTQRAHLEDVPMVGRLILLTPETITEQPRYFIWGAALTGFADRPVLGWELSSLETYIIYISVPNPEAASMWRLVSTGSIEYTICTWNGW